MAAAFVRRPDCDHCLRTASVTGLSLSADFNRALPSAYRLHDAVFIDEERLRNGSKPRRIIRIDEGRKRDAVAFVVPFCGFDSFGVQGQDRRL